MIEYIKRVSIAIGLLASRVGEKNQKLKSHLEDIGYDILILGQSFRLGLKWAYFCLQQSCFRQS
jgi:hypothetical protein